MNFFQLALHNLELDDAYNSAREYYSNNETLTRILSSIGVKGLLDNGDVLDSSMSNPSKFLKFTDALTEHLNDNLDTLNNAPTILSNLLNTQVISADSFVPDLSVSCNHDPSKVDVTFKGVGLSLSFFGSEPDEIPGEEPETIDLMDGILVEPERYTYLGRLVIYEDAVIYWSGTDESTTRLLEPEHAIEVELPSGSVSVEQITANHGPNHAADEV